MVKKIGVLLLCFLLWQCKDNDSPPSGLKPKINLVATYGGSGNEVAQSIITTNEGGYAVFGYSQSADGDLTGRFGNDFDYWLLKFDSFHNLQWSKTFGGTSSDKGFDCIQTEDGGFALVGLSESNDGDVSENFGGNDVWVVKTDNQGNIIWEVSHGFSGNDQGLSLLETSDNQLLIIGVLDVTASGGDGNDRFTARHAGGDYWAIKLDGNGNKIWRRYFGGSFTDTPYGIAPTIDGGFILAGSSDSTDVDVSENKGNYDYWIVKINANGDLVWERNFGGSQIDEARSIVRSNDGNYVILGDSRSNDFDITNPRGAADMWLIKIDDSGNLIWEKSIGGTSFDAGRKILSNTEGFLLTGSSRSSDLDVSENKGQNDGWIVQVDMNGNLVWQISCGGSQIDFYYGITELANGQIVAIGETNSADGDIDLNRGFTDLLITNIILE
ncbi:lipoprotein [Urechidicola sp. KH5]